MNKQKKQFLILCIVLVVCVIAYLIVSAYNKKQEEKESAEEEAAKITAFSVDADSITAFSYTLDGETLSFTKEDGEWKYDTDPSLNLNESTITTMLSDLTEVTAVEKITEDETEDSSEYGFDTPANTISVTADGKTTTISIGNYNEMLSEYYLMVEGEETVYLVDSTLTNTFANSVDSLIAEETDTETEEPEEVSATESVETTEQ